MKLSILNLVLSLSLFLAFSCGIKEKEKPSANQIIIRNLSGIELTDKPVIIKRSDIPFVPDNGSNPVVKTAEGDTVALQLDDLDGDDQWEELFMVVDLAANDSTILNLSWTEASPEYVKKTSVRFGKRESKDAQVQPITSDTIYADEIHAKLGYQPYQTDGPSWENDKVGFRHYFDGRNAKDLFGKKVSYMSPESVGINADGGVEDTYHVMNDWGRDILSVGNSAGLGGIELMIDDEIVRLGNVHGDTVTNFEYAVFDILKEGPVRSVIEFDYHNWQPVNDRSYEVQEKVSIWPGMYGYKNEVTVNGMDGDESLIVGLVNINTDMPVTEVIPNDDFVILYTHDKQTYEKEWWLGMALIVPKEAYQGHGEAPEEGQFSNSYYAKLNISNDKPVSYYALGAWELSDERFTDQEFFKNYVINLASQISADVEVTIK